MMLRFLIYLIGIVDNMKTSCNVTLFISGMFLLIILAIYITVIIHCSCPNKSAVTSGENMLNGVYKTKKVIKIAGILFALSIMFDIFIPSSKTIVAIYLIPKMVANEDVQALPGNTVKFLNSKLLEWMKDIELEMIPQNKDKK